MKKMLIGSLLVLGATSLLSGCYVEPGYSYVRGSGGGAYYGRSTTVYEGSYYAPYGYGYYDYPYAYSGGVRLGVGTTWYGGGHDRRGDRDDYRGYRDGDRRRYGEDHRGHWDREGDRHGDTARGGDGRDRGQPRQGRWQESRSGRQAQQSSRSAPQARPQPRRDNGSEQHRGRREGRDDRRR